MPRLFLLNIILVILFGLIACSSEEVTKRGEQEYKEQEVNLIVNEIYSWVNLMPGSEARFHITGDLEILESDDYDLNLINLVSVIVYHDSKVIYKISPVVKEDNDGLSNSRKIKFSTIRGLMVNRELDLDKKIHVDLVFDDDGSDLVYKIDNQNIYRAY